MTDRMIVMLAHLKILQAITKLICLNLSKVSPICAVVLVLFIYYYIYYLHNSIFNT